MKLTWAISLIVGLCTLSMQEHLQLFESPSHFPPPSYSFESNPLLQEKIDLGRMLFYDPILSKDSTISCASCHSPYNAFAHVDHALSHGIRDIIGTRNAPALFNLAWSSSFMWDGAIHHLDVQPLAPISSHEEMDMSIQEVVQKLEQSPMYALRFKNAFDVEGITGEQVLKCLSQFQLTLVSASSKYDQVVKGENVFTTQEKNGYTLFQQHCDRCHAEPLFTSPGFESNGLAMDSTLRDLGRAKITTKKEDHGKFKVPSLRNLDYTFPYMHDGRFKKLSHVLDHYTSANISPKISLSENEKKDLLSFLIALNDTAFIFRKENKYPHQLYNSIP